MEEKLDALANRIGALERQNRVLKQLMSTAVLTLIVTVTVGAAHNWGNDNPVLHRAPNGREMSLGWDPAHRDAVGISIKDKNGVLRCAFGLDQNNKGILMFLNEVGLPTRQINE